MKQPPTPPAPENHELRFTQNFLRDRSLVERIVQLADLQPGSTVLEIGPGKGIITKALAERVSTSGHVIAVELDAGLTESLRRQFSPLPQVEILQGDILKFDLSRFHGEYSVFSNIPFNITSELLEYLFQPTTGPVRAHLILQTDALTGHFEHGIKTETFKSMMIQPLYRIEAVHTFAKSDFVPQPAVETALFAFERRTDPLLDPAQYTTLYKDFLAFVSKDRVGEGVWRRLFSKPQLEKLAEIGGLTYGRGLKSQSVEGIVNAFRSFTTLNRSKQGIVAGAMARLREEQKHREQINRAGGHRRGTRPTSNIPNRHKKIKPG